FVCRFMVAQSVLLGLLVTAKYWRRAGEIALLMSYVGMLPKVQMLILITVSPPFANILLAAVFRQPIT
ncbi:hypothetical protein C7N43_19975, partial [Sphingobacteriales bacterium UPWRP_1]